MLWLVLILGGEALLALLAISLAVAAAQGDEMLKAAGLLPDLPDGKESRPLQPGKRPSAPSKLPHQAKA